MCSRGKVHELYKNFPGYHCGEYFDDVVSGNYLDGVMCVDMQNMPFEDNYFDFVITEDVLEHVWDISQALKEVNRVLKLGGKHIFTVPVHENVVTMSRKNNKLEVFHGDPLRPEGAKVITDFGRDIASFVDRFGMKTTMYKLHNFHEADQTSFIDDEAENYKKNWRNMLEVFRYNSIVLVSEKVVDYDMTAKKQQTEKNDKCTLNFTGERFIPYVSDKYIVAEHIQRYKSVLKLVQGKKVLDAACGVGYGTALMASVAEEVTGIDISCEAVQYAKKRYSDIGNVSYLEASIAELPFPDKTFDIIISFETIEHVNEAIQNSFLKEIRRCLKDDGILVMSTPDKRTYSDIPNFNNEFHIKEFYFDDFDIFLRHEFEYVEHYLQGERNLSGELLYPAKGHVGKLDVLNNICADEDKDHYIVSLCSNRQINLQEDISSWLSYEYVPVAYTYTDNSYKQEDIIFPSFFEHSDTVYSVRFDLKDVCTDGRLRVDPLENECCEMEIISIKTDAKDYNVIASNAITQVGSKYTFITIDPILEIFGDFSTASYLEIEYVLRILSVREVSMFAYEKFKLDANNYEIKMEAFTEELQAIKSSKGYRLLQKMRKMRNSIKL